MAQIQEATNMKCILDLIQSTKQRLLNYGGCNSIHYRWLYYRYYFSFIRHIKKHWSNSSDELINKHISKINYAKFSEYLIHSESSISTFPLMYLTYWAFKFSIDVELRGCEYSDFTDYIESVNAGIRPAPEWMINEFPTVNHIPNFIPCQSAINKRYDDLAYKIKLKNHFYLGSKAEEQWKLHEQCDIFDFLIENCAGEWYYDEFAGTVTVHFTEETDCVGFKLAWS